MISRRQFGRALRLHLRGLLAHHAAEPPASAAAISDPPPATLRIPAREARAKLFAMFDEDGDGSLAPAEVEGAVAQLWPVNARSEYKRVLEYLSRYGIR